MHRANIQPFNVGLSASLTRCTIEKKREGERKKRKTSLHVAESSFPPSVKERTVVAEKGEWSNKNFWNKEAVGVSFSRKKRVGILGRNKLEFLWMWNSLRLNNVKRMCDIYECDYVYVVTYISQGDCRISFVNYNYFQLLLSFLFSHFWKILYFNKVISWNVNSILIFIKVICNFYFKTEILLSFIIFEIFFIIFTNNNNFNRKYIVKYYFHFIYLFHFIKIYFKDRILLPISISKCNETNQPLAITIK